MKKWVWFENNLWNQKKAEKNVKKLSWECFFFDKRFDFDQVAEAENFRRLNSMKKSTQNRNSFFDTKWFVAFFFESTSIEKKMSESFRSFIVKRAIFQRRFFFIGSTGRTQFSISVENETKIRSMNRTQFSASIEDETKISVRTKKDLIQNQNEKSLLSIRRGVQFNVYDTDSGFFRRIFIETEQQLQKKIAAMK